MQYHLDGRGCAGDPSAACLPTSEQGTAAGGTSRQPRVLGARGSSLLIRVLAERNGGAAGKAAEEDGGGPWACHGAREATPTAACADAPGASETESIESPEKGSRVRNPGSDLSK
jgi:hypothetical protein